ncbi:MAG: GNAT family N-acetyltransferase [Nitrosomonas sp.]|nr:GNAT family N-acetyltransferase [Nitrosomonas sp.]
MPTVAPLTSDDTELIIALASIIWHQHYSHIISPEQIEYMLNQRYSATLIQTQIRSDHTWWKKLVLDKQIIGFSCCIRTDNPKELKLDKLYLHPHHQRKGYGAMLVENIKQFMHDRSFEQLILTVNKNNTVAIAAYLRYGFTISDDIIIDIGHGFVMDDYLMTMPVK